MGILLILANWYSYRWMRDLSQDEFKQAWKYNMDAAQEIHKLMVGF